MLSHSFIGVRNAYLRSKDKVISKKGRKIFIFELKVVLYKNGSVYIKSMRMCIDTEILIYFVLLVYLEGTSKTPKFIEVLEDTEEGVRTRNLVLRLPTSGVTVKLGTPITEIGSVPIGLLKFLSLRN